MVVDTTLSDTTWYKYFINESLVFPARHLLISRPAFADIATDRY